MRRRLRARKSEKWRILFRRASPRIADSVVLQRNELMSSMDGRAPVTAQGNRPMQTVQPLMGGTEWLELVNL